MVTADIYFLCFPGPDNGKSEGYGLRLVRPDVHGQEIEGKGSCSCWLFVIDPYHTAYSNVSCIMHPDRVQRELWLR